MTSEEHEETLPFAKVFVVLALSAAAAAIGSASGHSQSADDGVIRVKSAYGVEGTVKILERDIAAKGIEFRSEITRPNSRRKPDQLRPSIL